MPPPVKFSEPAPEIPSIADASSFREFRKLDIAANRAAGAAAERERWVTVLADHYLMGVNCDPDTKRDNPMCGCSRINLGWHDSIGEARRAWIAHVASVADAT